MNQLESRFMRLKRYTQDDLEAIHHAEREAGNNWLARGVQHMNGLDARLGPFWDTGKLEEEKAREVAQFQACPVVKRAFAKLDDTQLDELPALHLADWEIHSKAYTPNFGKGSGSNREKLKEMYAPRAGLPYKDD